MNPSHKDTCLLRADKRQLSPAALSATLLQGSREKRRQHWALYQVFTDMIVTPPPPQFAVMPHITGGEPIGGPPDWEGGAERRSVFFLSFESCYIYFGKKKKVLVMYWGVSQPREWSCSVIWLLSTNTEEVWLTIRTLSISYQLHGWDWGWMLGWSQRTASWWSCSYFPGAWRLSEGQ